LRLSGGDSCRLGAFFSARRVSSLYASCRGCTPHSFGDHELRPIPIGGCTRHRRDDNLSYSGPWLYTGGNARREIPKCLRVHITHGLCTLAHSSRTRKQHYSCY
jgi:hypothetical protein